MTDTEKTLFTLKALVEGRVQGVYYRAFAERQAIKLQLCGYVHNLPDMSVEVFAEGTREHLEQFLVFLKAGPPGARVDDIDVTWAECQRKYRSFTLIP